MGGMQKFTEDKFPEGYKELLNSSTVDNLEQEDNLEWPSGRFRL